MSNTCDHVVGYDYSTGYPLVELISKLELMSEANKGSKPDSEFAYCPKCGEKL